MPRGDGRGGLASGAGETGRGRGSRGGTSDPTKGGDEEEVPRDRSRISRDGRDGTPRRTPPPPRSRGTLGGDWIVHPPTWMGRTERKRPDQGFRTVEGRGSSPTEASSGRPDSKRGSNRRKGVAAGRPGRFGQRAVEGHGTHDSIQISPALGSTRGARQGGGCLREWGKRSGPNLPYRQRYRTCRPGSSPPWHRARMRPSRRCTSIDGGTEGAHLRFVRAVAGSDAGLHPVRFRSERTHAASVSLWLVLSATPPFRVGVPGADASSMLFPRTQASHFPAPSPDPSFQPHWIYTSVSGRSDS
eukprot:scaffold2846_cov322-Pavlova_lutheri.AAC.14